MSFGGRTDPAYTVKKIVHEELTRCAETYARGRLLDIGCGTKDKDRLFRPYVDEYVGLDHPECKHGLAAVDLLGTAYDVPEPGESYDTAFCTAVLEHLEEPARAIRETYRVLRQGGHAIYTVPLFWHLHEQPRDFFRYTSFGLKHLFETAGFEIVELKPLSGFFVTAAAEMGYFVRNFRRGILSPLVDAYIAITSFLLPPLYLTRLRDERFSWMYLVVARKVVQ